MDTEMIDSTTDVDISPPPAKRARSAPAGQSLITSGAAGGTPGAIEYQQWKIPEGETRTFNQAFYVEILNANFLKGTVERTTQKHKYNYECPPYYIFPWQQLSWYLDLAQYNFLRKYTNHAQIENVRYQVLLVGQRLPFTTNGSDSSIANSSVDQTLDYYEAIEKKEAFDTYFVPDGSTSLESAGVTRLSNTTSANERITHFLWGDPRDSALKPDVAANQGNRKWHLRPVFVTRQYYDDADEIGESEYRAWHPWAREKKMSMDTKQSPKPAVICTVDYAPKNGIINHSRPFNFNRQDPLRDTLQSVHTRKLPYSLPNTYRDSNGVATSNPQAGSYQVNMDDLYKRHNITEGDASHLAVESKSMQLSSWASMDIENIGVSNTRTEPHIPNYRSIMFGIRPQMNGSTIQNGILQLEIRTEITVKYQIYFPLAGTAYWASTDNWSPGMSACEPTPGTTFLNNDEDVVIQRQWGLGQHRLPGNKLALIPAPYQ